MNKKDNFHAVFKKYFQKNEALLLPNLLCYLRLLLIPVFVTLYCLPTSIVSINEYANLYIATAIMLFSAYTDFLDGFIARKFDMRSNLGKVLDPLVDKFMQLGVSIAIVIKFLDNPFVYSLLIVFVLKEFWMMIMTIILARANRAFGSAKWYGKVSTFVFFVIVAVLFIGGPFINTLENGEILIDLLVSISLLFLIFAAVMYTILFSKLLKSGQNEV